MEAAEEARTALEAASLGTSSPPRLHQQLRTVELEDGRLTLQVLHMPKQAGLIF